jgi:hypothetical protein
MSGSIHRPNGERQSGFAPGCANGTYLIVIVK